MTSERQMRLREDIERDGREKGWDRYRVTTTNTETGEGETVEVPARDERHSKINAAFLSKLELRGERVEYEVERL